MNDQTQVTTEAATAAPVFVIESGIAIPARTIPNAGPRESKYPVDQLQEGQAFAVPVRDDKEARQKQSQFSGLAKTRGIKLQTRYFPTDSPFASVAAPCLGVWHAGKADEKDEATDTNEDAAAAEGGEASGAADTSAQATETQAEVLEL